jgi:hypothetical protein
MQLSFTRKTDTQICSSGAVSFFTKNLVRQGFAPTYGCPMLLASLEVAEDTIIHTYTTRNINDWSSLPKNVKIEFDKLKNAK